MQLGKQAKRVPSCPPAGGPQVRRERLGVCRAQGRSGLAGWHASDAPSGRAAGCPARSPRRLDARPCRVLRHLRPPAPESAPAPGRQAIRACSLATRLVQCGRPQPSPQGFLALRGTRQLLRRESLGVSARRRAAGRGRVRVSRLSGGPRSPARRARSQPSASPGPWHLRTAAVPDAKNGVSRDQEPNSC